MNGIMHTDKTDRKRPAGPAKRIKIVGFGNIYMADDGIGIRVIEALLEQDVFGQSEGIEVLDGGTCGMDLLFILEKADKLILIDAVDAGQKTAEIVLFSLHDIREIKKKNRLLKSYSLHDMDLGDVFEIIGNMGIDKEIKVIGIKPKKIELSEKLSDELEKKIPDIIGKIKEEVFGHQQGSKKQEEDSNGI
jgi:hydrogenase maturation protease